MADSSWQHRTKPDLALLKDAPLDDVTDPRVYHVRRCVRTKSAARVWLHPPGPLPGHSVQWMHIADIVTELAKESADAEQRIQIISAAGVFNIHGHHLDELADRLHEQHVTEIWAYDRKRWPTTRPGPEKPIVTSIKWIAPD